MGFLEPIFVALNEAGARYLVVGGVATVLHGFARFTHDLDLIVDQGPHEAEKVIATLTALGFRSRSAVAPASFADPDARRAWADEKLMVVFTRWDPENPLRVVDLFIRHPIDFEELWRDAETIELETTSVRIASLPHLIRLKQESARPQDLRDIEALELLMEDRRDREG